MKLINRELNIPRHWFYLSSVLCVSLLMIFFKFILFDLIWDYNTTYSSFSFMQSYVNKIGVSFLLTLPLLYISRRKIGMVVICLLTDIFLITNLMYFRVYNTSIPLDSYKLVFNLIDFTASVHDSIHMVDLLFFLSTIASYLLFVKFDTVSSAEYKNLERRNYMMYTLISCILVFILFKMNGGILKQDTSMQNANYFTVRVPVFTIFGSLYCDYMTKQEIYTPEVKTDIENWLKERLPYVPGVNIEKRDNCIIILVESFESWLLEIKVEGKEITPNLNEFLKEKHTLYAPKVLSQVKGGRSIDAQLMLNTGLLPIAEGAYSIKYPNHCYPSIVKAFKKAYPKAFTCIMTVDKDITWNQRKVAQAFDFDSLVWKKDFVLDEKVGSRKKLGDRSFFVQCAEKLESESFWSTKGHHLIECVTYSGHSPFKLPDNLKSIYFTSSMPQKMNDYMTMAHYTDHAIGEFVRFLRSKDKFKNTMIVIMGDHEGLASDRRELRETEIGRKYISSDKFVPLIVLNAPISLRYENVMGQIDIYPTLLNLLSLDDYEWKGLGNSIIGGFSTGFAIDPQREAIGDVVGIDSCVLNHSCQAWDISDCIIKYDYFHGMLRFLTQPKR